MGSRGYQTNRRLEKRKCIECGKVFETDRSAMYCSTKCKRKAQNRRNYIARKARKG